MLDEQFDRVAAAAVRRDAPEQAAAQRQFVAMLVGAGATDASSRRAVREHFLLRFLDAVDHERPHPVLTIAQRHQLAGMYAAPSIERTTLEAWFDFRWEAFAAPEALRGEAVTLASLLSRLPREEQRAVVGWVLASDCAAIVGVRPGTMLRSRDAEQCARARREFVDAAAALETTYPAQEARAAIDVMLGRDLRVAADHTVDETTRQDLRASAREAYERAHGAYTAIAAHEGSRRIRRYLRGALEASAAN